MNIIKRLQLHLAQHVYSYDDTYKKNLNLSYKKKNLNLSLVYLNKLIFQHIIMNLQIIQIYIVIHTGEISH